MSAIELQVYEIFKVKFGEQEATKVIEYFDRKAKEKINYKKDIFLTKEDKVDIIEKLATLETRITMRMIYFWKGQVAVIAGLLSYFFRLSGH